jgi:hypothetical protein
LVVSINGEKIVVGKPDLNFKHVNILGMDYLIGKKSLAYDMLGNGLPNCYLEI